MTDIGLLIETFATGGILDGTEISTAQVEALRALGMDVATGQDGKYRLSSSLELLTASRIREEMSEVTNDAVRDIECHLQIDSTNTRLMTMPSSLAMGRLCLAESQSAGRGRRGRTWQSPFGENIYMSLGWQVPVGISVSGVSLVVGMAITRALRSLGYMDLGLKWPNDVLVEIQGGYRKLAGILLEMSAPANGDHAIVIGVGVNVAMSGHASAMIDQPFATLRDLTPVQMADRESEFSRNRVVAAILNCLIPDLVRYNSTGFTPFASLWAEYDLYFGKRISVRIADQEMTGIHGGIDQEGQLIIDIDGRQRTFNAGEVSLRPVDGASDVTSS
ncbi:MAG: biotin--[acetyl-CoA-carboxylase] ligase [Pseudomonadota bacterium]